MLFQRGISSRSYCDGSEGVVGSCRPSARSSGSLRAKLLGFFAEFASGVLGWIAGVIGGRRVEPRPGRDHQPGPDQAGRPRVAGADLAPVGRRDRVVGVPRHDHPAARLGDAVAVLAAVWVRVSRGVPLRSVRCPRSAGDGRTRCGDGDQNGPHGHRDDAEYEPRDGHTLVRGLASVGLAQPDTTEDRRQQA